MTYIAGFFHAFSSMGAHDFLPLLFPKGSILIIARPVTPRRPSDQAETVSRRLEKFAELMQSIWLSRNDYERRIRAVRSLCYLNSIQYAHLTLKSSC